MAGSIEYYGLTCETYDVRFLKVFAVASLLTISLPVIAEDHNDSISYPTKDSTERFTSYILGPGDSLSIEIFGVPELSGKFSIGPDGTIYLPRLRVLYVEGLTVEELRLFLVDQYTQYLKSPDIFVAPIRYRPVRVYVGGEIGRPGYYTLSEVKSTLDVISEDSKAYSSIPDPSTLDSYQDSVRRPTRALSDEATILGNSYRWPTLFDAIRAAGGVTPFSDLSNIRVVRKQGVSAKGQRLQAEIPMIKLITDGNENVNIRLFDGDVVTVKRTQEATREQLLAATRTNLSPDFIQIFISGRVVEPGARQLPQGSTLNQALASAGGLRILHGKVEFLRFDQSGETDRRIIRLNKTAQPGDRNNPVLMRGDVIRVQDSLISAGVQVINEITGPAVGIYSIYSLFKP